MICRHSNPYDFAPFLFRVDLFEVLITPANSHWVTEITSIRQFFKGLLSMITRLPSFDTSQSRALFLEVFRP